jgi:hypothetical protein
MKIYRTEIHGHILELRYGDFGGQYVYIDGRLISQKPFAGWMSACSHGLTLDAETGKVHHIDMRVDAPALGIGQTRVVVSVDGIERCRLDPIDPRKPATRCANCGYELGNLRVENGEVRCPECGRHTSAKLLGLGDG